VRGSWWTAGTRLWSAPGAGRNAAGKPRCRYNKINADKSSRGGETRRGCFCCCAKIYFQGLFPAKNSPDPFQGAQRKNRALSIKTRLFCMYCTITAEQTVCGAGCPARRYSRHAAAGRADAAGEGECAMEILRVEDVGHKYQAENGEVTAFEHISFTVQKGEFMSIVGPSGCGKSTLLSIIAGLLPPTSGRVYVDGEVVTGISRHIGYMLQRDNLLEWRTILSNVLFGLEIRGAKTPQNVARARELLKTYGLYEFRHKYPRQLSGGMRQRVALIRTLATGPDILLLDEAFSALDYQTRLNVTDDVYRILKREQVTTLMVTHDIPESISMGDKILVLSARPAQVKEILSVDFGPGRSPLSCRANRQFGPYFDHIWKELSTDEKS